MNKNFAAIRALAAGRSASELPGTSQVKVNTWDVTYTDGTLQAIARVDPLNAAQRVIGLSVGVTSPDQKTQYVAAIFIPENNEEPVGVPGSGIWGLAQTHAYDRAKHGADVVAIIGGFVGSTPDDMQEFLFEKKLTF